MLDGADIARLEERIDAERSARRVYEALGGVPEATRQLLELVAVDGLPVAEAAAAVGISPLAARVRLHRARKYVRDLVLLPATEGNAHGYA